MGKKYLNKKNFLLVKKLILIHLEKFGKVVGEHESKIFKWKRDNYFEP